MASELVDTLLSDLAYLYSETDDYDVEVVVGSEESRKTFKAHANILRARSTYFRENLKIDPDKKKGEMTVFEKPEMDADIFETVLSYIYTGAVNIPDDKEIDFSSLLRATDEFRLVPLLNFIQDRLIRHEDLWIEDHLVELLQLTSQLESCKRLYAHCEEIIAVWPELIFKSDDFVQLELDVLKSLSKRDDLAMKEIEIWDRILEWGVEQHKELSGKDHSEWTNEDYSLLRGSLEELVPMIRFSSISSVEFYHKVLPYKKVLPKDLYRELLHFYLEPGYEPTIKMRGPRQKAAPADTVLMDERQTYWIRRHIRDVEHPGESGVGLPSTNEYELKLLARGSRDGFTPKDFHGRCDRAGPTVAVLRVTDHDELLGGYNPNEWHGLNEGKWEKATNSFIFALGDKDREAIFSPVKDPSDEQAIYNYHNCGPVFGTGCDLIMGVSTNNTSFRSGDTCHCRPKTFELPIRKDTGPFVVSEYEVFSVVRKAVSY